MRFLSADWIYPLHISPIKEGVLQVSDEGKVINIFENRSEVPSDQLEIFKGWLKIIDDYVVPFLRTKNGMYVTWGILFLLLILIN